MIELLRWYMLSKSRYKISFLCLWLDKSNLIISTLKKTDDKKITSFDCTKLLV